MNFALPQQLILPWKCITLAPPKMFYFYYLDEIPTTFQGKSHQCSPSHKNTQKVRTWVCVRETSTRRFDDTAGAALLTMCAKWTKENAHVLFVECTIRYDDEV